MFLWHLGLLQIASFRYATNNYYVRSLYLQTNSYLVMLRNVTFLKLTKDLRLPVVTHLTATNTWLNEKKTGDCVHCLLVTDIEIILCLQVTEAMTEEIGRLGLLVNEFDHPFHPHPGFLRTYKKVRITCMHS